jgi:hypothetical protein
MYFKILVATNLEQKNTISLIISIDYPFFGTFWPGRSVAMPEIPVPNGARAG